MGPVGSDDNIVARIQSEWGVTATGGACSSNATVSQRSLATQQVRVKKTIVSSPGSVPVRFNPEGGFRAVRPPIRITA